MKIVHLITAKKFTANSNFWLIPMAKLCIPRRNF